MLFRYDTLGAKTNFYAQGSVCSGNLECTWQNTNQLEAAYLKLTRRIGLFAPFNELTRTLLRWKDKLELKMP